MAEHKRALVLGGGGVAGIAWELGVLHGLTAAGIDLGAADLVVGTSAGSVVGAALRFGQADAAYQAQIAEDTPPAQYREPTAFSGEAFLNALAAAGAQGGGEQAARARIGELALGAATQLSEEQWVAQISALVPAAMWPERPLAVTTVDAGTGEFRVFGADDGVSLQRAVAASCAVPTVWPPVEMDGNRYMDGGIRSGTNADVAEGYDAVLVLSCGLEAPSSPFGPSLPQALEKLGRHSRVVLIEADAAALQAFGSNMLLQSTRRPSAEAGRRQAEQRLADVRELWGS